MRRWPAVLMNALQKSLSHCQFIYCWVVLDLRLAQAVYYFFLFRLCSVCLPVLCAVAAVSANSPICVILVPEISLVRSVLLLSTSSAYGDD